MSTKLTVEYAFKVPAQHRLALIPKTLLSHRWLMPHIPKQEWQIILHPEFEAWLADAPAELRGAVVQHLMLLAQPENGPGMGRPRVDTVKGSTYSNMKEYRFQFMAAPWRLLFAFDPLQQAAVLVAGDKSGNEIDESEWYKKNIPIADKRFKEHLSRVSKGTPDKKSKKTSGTNGRKKRK